MLKTASILACVAAASIFSCEVRAFPIAQVQAPVPEVLQVRGFCGLGFHRGPYGYCVRNSAAYGYVAPGPVVVAPPVMVAPPVVVAPRACPWGYGYAPAYGRCVPL
ncbi:MAG: GCG_CRPN prefix-to-repeats domain-containing protein [Bradyrhizobium sp.]